MGAYWYLIQKTKQLFWKCQICANCSFSENLFWINFPRCRAMSFYTYSTHFKQVFLAFLYTEILQILPIVCWFVLYLPCRSIFFGCFWFHRNRASFFLRSAPLTLFFSHSFFGSQCLHIPCVFYASHICLGVGGMCTSFKYFLNLIQVAKATYKPSSVTWLAQTAK